MRWAWVWGLAAALLSGSPGYAGDPDRTPGLDGHVLVSFEGEQKFRTGDDPAFARPDFDDSGWQTLPVPGSWRTEGVSAWEATGWYRIRFTLPPGADTGDLAVVLGTILWADQVWLNGVRIGEHGLWPDDGTGLRAYPPIAFRVYPVDGGLLRTGEDNLLAIRVGRHFSDGGIFGQPLGLIDRAVALDARDRTDRRYRLIFAFLSGADLFVAIAVLFGLIIGVRSRAMLAFCGMGLSFETAWLLKSHMAYDLGIQAIWTEQLAFILVGGPSLVLFVVFVSSILERPLRWWHLAILAAAVISIVGAVSGIGDYADGLARFVFSLVFMACALAIYMVCVVWSVQAVRAGLTFAWPLIVGFAVTLLFTGIELATPFGAFSIWSGRNFPEIGDRVWMICLALTLGSHYVWTQARLRRASVRILDAHEDERRRLARDIHDSVGQWLAVIGFDLERLHATGDAALVPRLLGNVERATEDARRVAHDLSPALIARADFAMVLRAHAALISEAAGVSITVAAPADLALGTRARDHLYRIFQETVKNATNHGGADRITVDVKATGGRLEMTIADNGTGFDTARRGGAAALGLTSIRERAELLGGHAMIASAVGRGTRVTISLPAGGVAHD